MKQKILTEKDRVTLAQYVYTKTQKNTPIKLKGISTYGYVAGKVDGLKTGEQDYLEQYQRLFGNVQQMERLLENIHTQLNKYADTVAQRDQQDAGSFGLN